MGLGRIALHHHPFGFLPLAAAGERSGREWNACSLVRRPSVRIRRPPWRKIVTGTVAACSRKIPPRRRREQRSALEDAPPRVRTADAGIRVERDLQQLPDRPVRRPPQHVTMRDDRGQERRTAHRLRGPIGAQKRVRVLDERIEIFSRRRLAQPESVADRNERAPELHVEIRDLSGVGAQDLRRAPRTILSSARTSSSVARLLKVGARQGCYDPGHAMPAFLAAPTIPSAVATVSSQCLDRRIPDKQVLTDEVAAWQHDRNKNRTRQTWHFTTANARIGNSSTSTVQSGSRTAGKGRFFAAPAG